MVERRDFLKGLGALGVCAVFFPETLPQTLSRETVEIRLSQANFEGREAGAAITTAINSLPSEVGRVRVILPKGTGRFRTTGRIFRNNVILEGQGPNTLFFLDDGANVPFIQAGDGRGHRKVTVRGINFEGNKDKQKDLWDSIPRFVYAKKVANLVLEDLSGENGWEAGFSAEGQASWLTRARITRCTANNCNGVGLVVASPFSVVDHFTSKRCAHGIQVREDSQATHVMTRYSLIESPLFQGIVFEKGCHYGVSYRDTIKDAPLEGLTATENHGFRFIEAEISGNTSLGHVVLSNASDGWVLGITSRDNLHPDGDGAAIILEGNCHRNKVWDNEIFNVRAGIWLKQNVKGENTYNEIVRNLIWGVTQNKRGGRDLGTSVGTGLGAGYGITILNSPHTKLVSNEVWEALKSILIVNSPGTVLKDPQGDGDITIDGRRYPIPGRYPTLRKHQFLGFSEA